DDGEGHHRLVADVLDHSPAMAFSDRADQFQAARDGNQRLRVAEPFVEPGAARDVGEQYGELGFVAAHLSIGKRHRAIHAGSIKNLVSAVHAAAREYSTSKGSLIPATPRRRRRYD